jgi:23S rRNA-/tRNA-specific pseudouridylate synthase
MRLPVLADCEREGWIALSKSARVGMRAHPWNAGPDLDTALNVQLNAGKPELLRTGASLFGSVYYLDPEISGVGVFARNRDALRDLRNRFGSGGCRFTFHFVAAAHETVESIFRADAPLLAHRVKPKMIPSTAKGKKSFTDFRKLAESLEGWALWEAQCDFFRAHQVRAHAATHEIAVLGDELYGGAPVPTVQCLKPRKRRSGPIVPALEGIALHLSEVDLNPENGAEIIRAPLPKQFALMLKRMRLPFSGQGVECSAKCSE